MRNILKQSLHTSVQPVVHPEKPDLQRKSSRFVVNQLLWVVLPVLLMVQIGATLLMEVRASTQAAQALAARIESLAEARAKLLANPMREMRFNDLPALLVDIVHEDGVISAEIKDASDETVASATSGLQADASKAIVKDISYRNGSVSASAGQLILSYVIPNSHYNFWKHYTPVLLVAGLAALALTLALRAAARDMIGAPLAAMLTAIRFTRDNGLQPYKVSIQADNEFKDLAEAYNELIEFGLHAKRTLEFQATHDELTGLANRRLMPAQLAALQEKEKREVALHFVDLDSFKGINDTFGHDAGDQYLVHIARRLQACLGEEDWAARIGGDEFIVIQGNAAGEEGARMFAARLLDAIAQPVELQGKRIVPRASIGIAIRCSDDPEVRNLPALADIALYHAKSLRTGSVAVLNQKLLHRYARRRELELALPAAFEHRQFEVWFQCQVDMKSDRISGLEALVRWRHPEHGMVPPAEFVPLIEQAGLSSQLARLVFECVCEARKALVAAGFGKVNVAFNVSPHELTDFSFAEAMEEIADQQDVELSGIEIEITEGLLINNVAHTREALARIRAAGVTVALDDFGQGYSSLAYLRNFPVDKLKIDKVFIRDVPQDLDDLAVLEIIVALADKLRLSVVAEGVEREEQANVLRRLGVEQGQGYLFHRPQPLAQVLEFMHAQARPEPAHSLRAG